MATAGTAIGKGDAVGGPLHVLHAHQMLGAIRADHDVGLEVAKLDVVQHGKSSARASGGPKTDADSPNYRARIYAHRDGDSRLPKGNAQVNLAPRRGCSELPEAFVTCRTKNIGPKSYSGKRNGGWRRA